ncbi:hypothetical protein CVT25_009257 [Psilocybe cyanescens]|uniref:Translocon Sec61/SecY plug domain-containing protein n=1 Tax=Psilocybe cyanescens TaxID=93625 RepID=A0A409XTT5_PSICY|nr:hypothetical protein CVT25_009257 [Psilocybe cyanescens]
MRDERERMKKRALTATGVAMCGFGLRIVTACPSHPLSVTEMIRNSSPDFKVRFLSLNPAQQVLTSYRKVPFNKSTMDGGNTPYLHVPLYGIVSSDSSDPLYWMRVILASNRRTLMELAFGRCNLIALDFSLKADRALLSGAQNLFALIIALGKATVYVPTGLYDQPSNLGASVCLLLIIQLIVAALIVILLDELLQKGYGLGSGINLPSLEGMLPYHCEHWTDEIPAELNVEILADVLSPFSCYSLDSLLSDLQSLEDSPQLRAIGGITYYMSPPHTLKEAVCVPIHTAIYIAFMQSTCALFIKMWIEISGSGPKDVAKQLKDQQMVGFFFFFLLICVGFPVPISTSPTRRDAMPPTYLSTLPFLLFSCLSWPATLSPSFGERGERNTIADSVWMSVFLNVDREIGMRELGEPEMAAFGNLL